VNVGSAKTGLCFRSERLVTYIEEKRSVFFALLFHFFEKIFFKVQNSTGFDI